MPKRKADSTEVDNEMTSNAQKSTPEQAEGKLTISTDNPLAEYIKLIETKVTVDQIVDDDITKENFKQIAQAARDVIWQLLFSSDVNAESEKKASDLLEEYKSDACFYAPWPYNEWIVKVRDELLKREQLSFWRETIVRKQLGPCWSRDSDLFDCDDEPPLEFYAHAGCIAPFAASLKVRAAEKAASGDEDATTSSEAERGTSNAAALSGNFEAKIGKEQPLSDYRELMKRYVLTTVTVPDDIHKQNVDKIGKAARAAIWQLLFEGESPEQSDYDKAAELLQEYKSDCGFYGPWEYNEWVVKLRDELIQRQMVSFWGDSIVKLELGPCCSRDSDFFEGDEPLPVEFYNKAGFKAPFNQRENEI
ncbi:uncharacterized protein LOC6566669 [Drosophila grimshawi]|uniref:GH13511 n=1 Tax=Drosophila grimshawi TaxID=7222 RepID=B4JPF4_DROGR|nr:uncharacterized protein LOC6566669 [Drosophila grimshawi]EDV98784.1 GH13511 [Drosophila grimshawi]